eukprot:TRINITY_DN5163_c0_g1_i1.p1 TRINITY_DN5163_c0_g1~~TRINITY_DN5163_c0_g1_i1.p1  ORF type:complete len:471 (-),score=82.41 TRINITY_DN5163_c0_g1_i1:131-1543(-)
MSTSRCPVGPFHLDKIIHRLITLLAPWLCSSNKIMDQWQTLFVILGLLLLVSVSSSYRLFYLFRQHPLIHNRGFWSTSVSVISLCFYGIFNCIYQAFGDSLNCMSTELPGDLAAILSFLFTLERLLLLVIFFNIAVQSKSLVDEGHQSSKVSWFLRHRKYFHHGLTSPLKLGIFGLTCLIAVTVGLYSLSNHAGATSLSSSPECVAYRDKVHYIIGGMGFFVLPSMLECVRRLRHLRENFHIRAELKLFGVFVGIALIFVILVWAIRGLDRRAAHIVIYVFVPMSSIYLSFIRVYLLVRTDLKNSGMQTIGESQLTATSQNRDRESAATKSWNSTSDVRSILDNPSILPIFEKFMIQEFAVENVYFLKSVDKFKGTADSMTQEELLSSAQTVCARFCDENSELCINLSSRVRTDVLSRVQTGNLDGTVFNAAEREIMLLIAQDSLGRFMRSQDMCCSGTLAPIPVIPIES